MKGWWWRCNFLFLGEFFCLFRSFWSFILSFSLEDSLVFYFFLFSLIIARRMIERGPAKRETEQGREATQGEKKGNDGRGQTRVFFLFSSSLSPFFLSPSISLSCFLSLPCLLFPRSLYDARDKQRHKQCEAEMDPTRRNHKETSKK